MQDVHSIHLLLKRTHTLKDDFFQEIYSNPIINLSMIGIYSVGLISCAGLRLVSWFERSGQAGPYRTLVNQLMLIIVDWISYRYIELFFKTRMEPHVPNLH